MCRRRRVSGFRAYLPTACNCYDDENDHDEPDLSTVGGRVMQRFEKVQADMHMMSVRHRSVR